MMDHSAFVRCMRLARGGDEEALGSLLAAYRNYLRVIADSSIDLAVRSKVDPSDAVQETLLKAYRNFHQFRGSTEPEWVGWVRRILVNSLAEVHRRFALAGRRVSRERSLESLVERSSHALRDLPSASGTSPSQHALRRERSAMLADVLADLDPDDREVVILRNLRGLPWDAVASRMQRSCDAVRMLWTRAVRRIGPLLKERMS